MSNNSRKENIIQDRKCHKINSYIGGRQCEVRNFIEFEKHGKTTHRFKQNYQLGGRTLQKPALKNETGIHPKNSTGTIRIQDERRLDLKKTVKAIKSLKNGKASGQKEIYAEMVKNRIPKQFQNGQHIL